MMEPSKTAVPSQEALYRQETHCPSCGRFVGVYERCPYCQALTQKRLSIRVFKTISILVSTVGLLLLLFFARTIRTPDVRISDLGPLSNFAHVRVVGQVERSFGVHPQWNSLSFILKQPSTGSEPATIRVSAYAKVALEIQKTGRVPAEGDQVAVEGQVRFQKDAPSLLINAPEHLRVLRAAEGPTGTALEPENVTEDHMGKHVTCKGKALESLTFPRGTLIRLDDGKDGLAIWIPSYAADDMKESVHPGDEVRVFGRVKPYKDSIEIEVTSSDGVKVMARGAGKAPRTVGSIGREDATEATAIATPTPVPAPPAAPEPEGGPMGLATEGASVAPASSESAIAPAGIATAGAAIASAPATGGIP